MYEALPAIRSWLFEAAFQANTAGVIVRWYRSTMYFTASMARAVLARAQDHIVVLVLHRGAPGPQDRARHHVRVQLLRHADADLHALLLADFFTDLQQLHPGVGAVVH